MIIRRARLAAAVMAATLALTGCIGDDDDSSTPTDAVMGFDPVPLSGSPVIPFPFDALYAGSATPTLNIPNPTSVGFVADANKVDGFSTTASWFMDVFGFLDIATIPANLVILNKSTGQPLVYGTDFTIQVSTVRDDAGVPINQQRTRILIEPLKPLQPSTTYVVALRNGVRTVDGGGVLPSVMFSVLSSATPVASQTEPLLSRYSAAQKAQLEALRASLIRPAVAGLAAAGITNVVMAYTVTTQSTTKTLDRLAPTLTAQPIAAFPTGKTTQNLNPQLGANADVYLGTLQVPYYLPTPANATPANPTPTLNGFWKADTSKPDTAATFLGQVPCGAYATGAVLPTGQTAAASASTTTCFPLPVKQSDQTIPMLVTVPNDRAKPAGGWPVVIFQHGITRDRSDMLAIAPALAQAGFVVVAIDLPLHGLPNSGALSALRVPGVGERTFDVDFVNNTTSAAGPDGTPDASGTHFINLASLITSRDNVRQGAVDILVLARSLANLDLDGGGPDIDTTKVRFVGQSLGSIVGTVALGADQTPLIGAGALSVDGGGIAKLLDASKAFGPRIRAGLAASGAVEGTDRYETYMRFAQTLLDSGDPVNFATAARTAHPILLTEVINDLVVPNQALRCVPNAANDTSGTPAGCLASQDAVYVSGLLSGTEPLGRVMGLQQVTPVLDVNALTATQLVNPAGGLDVWVRFSQGTHGSLLDPGTTATSLAVTQEMQRQTVNFVATNGVCLPIGQNCALP